MFRLLKTESFKLSNKLKSWLGPLLIMVLVLIAFPLSIDISQYDLEKFYFSIIVVSLLMTSFVATEVMFEEDFEDGSLEQEFLIEKDFYFEEGDTLLFEIDLNEKSFYIINNNVKDSCLSIYFENLAENIEVIGFV